MSLRWTFKEHWWGETACFRAAGYDVFVIDEDGDGSRWTLKRGKVVIAEGGTYECVPLYHFDACLVQAEARLREQVRNRVAELRQRVP